MTVTGTTVLAYAHPVAGGIVILLLLYAGSLGLRARSDRRRARQHLARHARLAPWVYAAVLASWVGGLLSTWQLRDDLDLGGSAHLRIGVALLLALTGSALTSRGMQRPLAHPRASRLARDIHPWFGAAAMLLAAAQVFFGLQITP